MQDVNGKHLLKVEPLNAILDPQYFVRAVHQCTLNVLHGREADAFQHAAENAGSGYIPPYIHSCHPWTYPNVKLLPYASTLCPMALVLPSCLHLSCQHAHIPDRCATGQPGFHGCAQAHKVRCRLQRSHSHTHTQMCHCARACWWRRQPLQRLIPLRSCSCAARALWPSAPSQRTLSVHSSVEPSYLSRQCWWRRRPLQRLSPLRSYDGTAVALRQRAPPAAHSRRARELWSLMRSRLTAVIRLRAAMRNS